MKNCPHLSTQNSAAIVIFPNHKLRTTGSVQWDHTRGNCWKGLSFVNDNIIMSTKHLRRYLQEKKIIGEEKSPVRKEEEGFESASEEEGSGAFVCNRYEFLEKSGEGSDESSGSIEELLVEERSENKEKKIIKKKKKEKKEKKKVHYMNINNRLRILKFHRRKLRLSKLKDEMFEKDLFKIDSRMLNVENELRSILGRRSTDTVQRGRMIFGKIVKKKPTWPEVKNVGKTFQIYYWIWLSVLPA
ncbi:unnamed protein product [Acanthocheilonema viteae]|uniref:Uncharacterized protein n=1 Tax=Acanthocheilonema viteae TaxID=6277 RepID=A0A498SE10_ACAVI|nr:unnamed protein product [Acanthocheilonema viteae]